MSDREVKFKLGWFNVFNLGGALYGWMHGHTWEDAAVGFLAGSVLPFIVIFGFLAIALLVVKSGEFIADSMPTKVRIAQRVETDEQRWEREYAEHCKSANLPNELAKDYRSLSTYNGDYEFTTSSSSDAGSYYTSGGGPG